MVSNSNMEWTDEKTFRLIAVYEQQTDLYDIQSKDYHNRNVKKRVIECLSRELGTTGWCFDLSLLLFSALYETMAAVAVNTFEIIMTIFDLITIN